MADMNSIYSELRSIKDGLEVAIDRVNDLIDDVHEAAQHEKKALDTDFSEDKERFVAP